jgi:galactokinase
LELARIGQEAEHLFAVVRYGLLDQVTSLFARRDHAVFLDCRSLEVQRMPVLREARFAVVQSGVKYALSDGAYNTRREECEEAAHALGLGKLREADLAAGALSGAPLTGGGFVGAILALVASGHEADYIGEIRSQARAAWSSEPQCLVTGAGGA